MIEKVQQEDTQTNAAEASTSTSYMHEVVSGAINQHTPSYWRLALPALGARYVARYASGFFKDEKYGAKWYDAAAGAWMLCVTALFAYRTGKDMKSIFSEAVAYEFDKNPEDVNVTDLMNSHNKTVVTARKNYTLYNAMRVAVNSAFFASFMPGKSELVDRIQNRPSVDLGMGANSAYLTMEILGRGRTFFEQVQSFVDLKLSNKNSLGEPITAIELMQLFQRNAMDNDKESVMDVKTHPEVIRNGRVIFERMAELMNDTYLIRPKGDKDNFALPKFIYMIGNDLIQPKQPKTSLLYIEIANRYGIGALKEAVREVHKGVSIDELVEKYQVILPALVMKPLAVSPEVQAKKFADSVPSKVSAAYTDLAGGATKAEEGFVSRMKEAQINPQTGPILAN